MRAIYLLSNNWRATLTFGMNVGVDCIIRSIGYSSEIFRTCSSFEDSSGSSDLLDASDS